MSDVAIRVQGLAKQYRIGKAQTHVNGRRSLVHTVAAPFHYLATTLREPAPDEVLWALHDISFEVERGKALAVVGRNGAGKSTLLKVLARITEPARGKAEIHGRVGALLEVGTGFHPELTGRENIFLSGAILGMRRTEITRKFDEIIAFSGVEKFIDTPIKYYSSGMRVRLGFAVAAHLEPEILLIDEVLAVGDAEFQKRCLGKMDEVTHQGRTVLFVSHNMAAVQALCTRGIYLQDGRVLVDGSASDAVSAYLKTIEKMTARGLSARTDRDGKGGVKLVGVDIDDLSGRGSNTLITGCPARFSFHFSDIPHGMILEYVDFAIYDLNGLPIAYFNTSEAGARDVRDPNMQSQVVCEVDELLLVPGRYRVNVGIKAGGDIQDHVEAAAYFNVEEGHIRGRPVVVTGQRPGSVRLPHRWALPISNRAS